MQSPFCIPGLLNPWWFQTRGDSILIYDNYSQRRTEKKIASRWVTNLMTYIRGVEDHSRVIPGIKKGSIANPTRHRGPAAAPLVTPGHCTWIIYKRLSRRMAADVSLVYLSTVSTILYFSFYPSSSYSSLRRSTTVAFLSLYLRRLNRPPPGLIALFACFPVPAMEGCHTELTRCICLSRSLSAPPQNRSASPAYARAS